MKPIHVVRYLLIGLAVGLAACNTTPPAPLDEAKAALTAKDSARAITVLEKTVADDPGSAVAHVVLGQAYFRADRKADAEKQFSAGFSLDSAASLTADATAEEQFLAGNVHATLGQFDQALGAYQATLKIQPDKAGAYTNIGVVYYQTGKLDDAIGQFKKALELDAKDAETHYLLGAAYVQKDNLTDAEAEFNTALTLKPELAPAHIGLGNVYLISQKFDQAVASLEKAIALQPDSPEALFALGQAYASVGRTPDAITALTKCVQLNPPEPFLSKAQEILQQLGAPK
ncbi:MAG TPA: tetratricopeptide repeat protein [Anaerolineae bacterium]|nr:tetratricopeptide repeat protein [Anaerolineae bacterium]